MMGRALDHTGRTCPVRVSHLRRRVLGRSFEVPGPLQNENPPVLRPGRACKGSVGARPHPRRRLVMMGRAPDHTGRAEQHRLPSVPRRAVVHARPVLVGSRRRPERTSPPPRPCSVRAPPICPARRGECMEPARIAQRLPDRSVGPENARTGLTGRRGASAEFAKSTCCAIRVEQGSRTSLSAALCWSSSDRATERARCTTGRTKIAFTSR